MKGTLKFTSLGDRLLPKQPKDELEHVFFRNNALRADTQEGFSSSKTQLERRSVILLSFAQLSEMGHPLTKPGLLDESHIKLLAARWEKEGLAGSTLRTRISFLSTFADWIGKPGMVKSPKHYFTKEAVSRAYDARKNRVQPTLKVDPEIVIAKARELDERVALYLSLQYHFGLGVKESIELTPAQALVNNGTVILLYVWEGTLSRRSLFLPIETPQQRETIEWAMSVAAKSRGGRIRPPGRTYRQEQHRFYVVLQRALGANRRELGMTAQCLRESYVQRKDGRCSAISTSDSQPA